MQKVLVGREITPAPKVLLTAYAVRGLDIHSSYTIYNLINDQKKQDVAVVYVGEDLDVLVELCDRILVLCGGKVSGIVPGRGADKREIGMMMTATWEVTLSMSEAKREPLFHISKSERTFRGRRRC